MIFAILSVVVMPLIAGYLYGMNSIDPYSYRGKIYYASEVD